MVRFTRSINMKVKIDNLPEKNICLCVSFRTQNDPFSCFVTDVPPDLHVVRHVQAFPFLQPANKSKTKDTDKEQKTL